LTKDILGEIAYRQSNLSMIGWSYPKSGWFRKL
jgi:hypothetical protein